MDALPAPPALPWPWVRYYSLSPPFFTVICGQPSPVGIVRSAWDAPWASQAAPRSPAKPRHIHREWHFWQK